MKSSISRNTFPKCLQGDFVCFSVILKALISEREQLLGKGGESSRRVQAGEDRRTEPRVSQLLVSEEKIRLLCPTEALTTLIKGRGGRRRHTNYFVLQSLRTQPAEGRQAEAKSPGFFRLLTGYGLSQFLYF